MTETATVSQSSWGNSGGRKCYQRWTGSLLLHVISVVHRQHYLTESPRVNPLLIKIPQVPFVKSCIALKRGEPLTHWSTAYSSVSLHLIISTSNRTLPSSRQITNMNTLSVSRWMPFLYFASKCTLMAHFIVLASNFLHMKFSCLNDLSLN